VTWAEYWNGETTIYVNARHKSVHYEVVARDVVQHLPSASARVVDYGCGEALSAHRIADACGHLLLCDSAPRVRERLVARYAGRTNIAVISPAEFEKLSPGTIDMIVVNSVVQYLSAPEFGHLLAISRNKLSRGGRLLIADLIPRHVGPVRDAVELMKFARRHGFLLSAAAGLVKSYFSSYRHKRNRFGLLRFDEGEIIALLAQSGFEAERRYPNVGHNARRMTVLAVPVDTEAAAGTPPPEAEREGRALGPLPAGSQG
jgi:SAM-dependent methyltransferase